MKPFLLLSISWIIAIHISYAQCPETTTLQYNSQSEIDSFILNYPNCTQVRTIHLEASSEDPIINLSGFSNLDTITNGIFFRELSEIISLSGMENLKHIGRIEFINVTSLKNLDGLENLLSTGSFRIENCTQLENTTALESLRFINGRFEIEDNPLLEELGSFPDLELISFDFVVTGNHSLNKISGFNKLTAVTSDEFFISNNDNLLSVEGFNALSTVGKNFRIRGTKLNVIDGFNSLVSLSEDLTFDDQDYLQILRGFGNLKTLEGDLIIEQNLRLKEIPKFDSLNHIGGRIIMNWNSSLEKIDMMDNLKTIEGWGISIFSNPKLETLDGFSNLNQVGNRIEIYSNSQLLTIPEFNNLEFLKVLLINGNEKLQLVEGFGRVLEGEDIEIRENDSLKIIPDFNALIKIQNYTVWGNERLENLSSLPNLTTLGRFTCEFNNSISTINTCQKVRESDFIKFLYNDKISEINGFESLDKVCGDISIVDHPELRIIPQFQELDSVEFIFIRENPNLSELDGFSQVDSTQIITISGNGIDKIVGFEKCSHSDLTISNNPELISIIGFENLQKGEIDIRDNDKLVLLPDFKELKELNSLYIINNSSLISIEGFKNIEAITKFIEINENSQLIEIPTFNKISESEILSLSIVDNASLETISGFTNVSGINNVMISGPSLKLIDGFNSVKFIGEERFEVTTGFSGLYLRDMPLLQTISGFESLDTIRGRFNIYNNDQLTQIADFEKLKYINNTFEFYNNLNIEIFDGLPNLIRIGGEYELRDNPKLKSVPSHINLEIVNDDILVSGDSISSVLGFQSLTTVEEFFRIHQTNLENIKGLENMDLSTTGILVFTENPKLSSCAIEPVCLAILNDELFRLSFRDNAEGCNEIEEINCNSISVSGTVFYDFNENKIKDDNEPILENIRIDVQPDDQIKLSNSDGQYIQLCEEGNEYLISPFLEDQWRITTDSQNYNFIFEPRAFSNLHMDFGLVPTFDKHEGEIILTSKATRCNTVVDFSLRYANNGTFEESGQIELCLDDQASFVSASPAPSIIDESCIIWRFENLRPFFGDKIELEIEMPDEFSTGETINFTSKMYADDELLDSYEYTPLVICSYDPNDKSVMPSGRDDVNTIIQGQELTYTIRFQNEGNASAINVSIQDTLSEHLDLSSFKVLDSSFPVNTTLSGNNVVFDFNNIYLVPKSEDEDESQGYVTYRISTNLNLIYGTEIRNTAFIYFDFNAPIKTNQTINTIESPNAINNNIVEPFISIRPNPTYNSFCVDVDFKLDKIELYDVDGRKFIETTKNCIDIDDYSSGLYIVKLYSNGNAYSKKLSIINK